MATIKCDIHKPYLVAIQFQPITLQRIGRNVIMIGRDLIVIMFRRVTIASRHNHKIRCDVITIRSRSGVITSRPTMNRSRPNYNWWRVITIILWPSLCNAIVLIYFATNYNYIAINFPEYDWPEMHCDIYNWIATNFVGWHWLKLHQGVFQLDCDQLSHYDDAVMGAIASLITSLTIVYSTVYSDAD